MLGEDCGNFSLMIIAKRGTKTAIAESTSSSWLKDFHPLEFNWSLCRDASPERFEILVSLSMGHTNEGLRFGIS